jgi:hypothetical protein
MFSHHPAAPRWHGRLPWAVVCAVLAALLVACSGSDAPPAGVGSGFGPLASVCPATVVVQTSWFPEATHGSLYQLLGPGYVVDGKLKRVRGRLYDDGRDTGLGLEIRAGGPAVGYQPVAALMRSDPSITLGQQATEEQVLGAAQRQATTAVISTLDRDPLFYGWDKKRHPDWNVITDIGQTSATVYSLRSPDVDYLIGAGILRASQINYSYDGSPRWFMADRASAVGGFSTNELHTYQSLGVDMGYAYVGDSGDPNYRNGLTVRTGELGGLGGCLRRLVPVLQRGVVDFLDHPDQALKVVVSLNTAYHSTFPYDVAAARAGVATMRRDGLVANGPGQVLGAFDPVRVGKEIELLRPIYAGQHVSVPADLDVGDLETGVYLDHSIRLPAA